MKPFIFVLHVAVMVSIGIFHTPVQACEQWQEKIDRVNAYKRKGGNAKQVNRWNKERKFYAQQYYECQREKPRIHTASKRSTRNQSAPIAVQQLRTSQSTNPVIQQLLATCNFWIATTNHHPTQDNRNFRDSACSTFEQAEQNPPAISAAPELQRKVSACIKPGNLIDEDVHACMKGALDPYWRTD